LIKDNFDVIVAGGGVAGAAAAIASARSGMRTCLIEKNDFIGGIGYSGLLRHICGLYINGDNFPEETLNEGMSREIVSLLNKLSPEKKVQKIGKVYVLPYATENLKSVFNTLSNSESNLEIYLNTSIVSVKIKGSEATGIIVEHSGEKYDISTKVLIDCTGNGEVSVMAGAGFDLASSDELQLAGYVLFIKGMKPYDEALQLKVPLCLKDAVEKKILPSHLRFSVLSPGDAPDEGYLKISLIPVNDRAASDAISVHKYLSEKLEHFRGSFIAGTSHSVMQREGRRLKGKYTLTSEDIMNARKFPDSIAKNAWPIEIWDRNKGTIYKYVPKGDYYEIPFGCIKVKGFDNLLCAGRCISVSHEALGSTRVIGTCISLGEQAGIAAANKIKNGKYLLSGNKI
jgi:hypothetical protein